MIRFELLILHTGCFEVTEPLKEALEQLEQKGSVMHIHLQELEDDDTWDHKLGIILDAPRIFCV